MHMLTCSRTPSRPPRMGIKGSCRGPWRQIEATCTTAAKLQHKEHMTTQDDQAQASMDYATSIVHWPLSAACNRAWHKPNTPGQSFKNAVRKAPERKTTPEPDIMPEKYRSKENTSKKGKKRPKHRKLDENDEGFLLPGRNKCDCQVSSLKKITEDCDQKL